MRKKIFGFIIVVLVLFEIFPRNVFAAGLDFTESCIDNIESLTGNKNDNSNYQIIKMADKLNDEKFEQWSENMIDLVISVLDSPIDVVDNSATASYFLGKNVSSVEYSVEERRTYLEKAKEAMSYLLLDLYELADLENYMVTEVDVYFGPWNLAEIPFLSEATGFGKVSWNKDEQQRVFSFRNKLLTKLEIEKVGEAQKYIESAELTYRGALAATGFSSYNTYGFTKSLADRKKFTEHQIWQYYRSYGYNYIGTSSKNHKSEKEELEKEWCKTLGFESSDELKEYAIGIIKELGEKKNGATEEKISELDDKTHEIKTDPDRGTIFSLPKRIAKEKGKAAADDVVNDADNFINDPNSASYVKTGELQEFSQNIYSILLGIGIVIAVIMGAIIGVKLMFAPLEERAEAKKLLIPYAVGCVLVFGAFGIWKLIITILQDL